MSREEAVNTPSVWGRRRKKKLNGDNENFVGNKAEATRRGKGMGPSCLIKKAFSCHLACRTGFIICLFFFIQAALAVIITIMASLLPYALFAFP